MALDDEDGEHEEGEADDPEEDDGHTVGSGVVLVRVLPALDAHVQSQVAVPVVKDLHAVEVAKSDGCDGGQRYEYDDDD